MTAGAAIPAGDSAAALPILERWVEDFSRALESQSEAALGALFLDDSYWRDFAACTWDVQTVHGAGDIAAALLTVAEPEKVHDFCLEPGKPVQVIERPPPWQRSLEALITFDTASIRGRGYLKLVAGPGGEWRAWTLLTTPDELKGHPELIGSNRPVGELRRPALNWRDRRAAEVEFSDRDPQVLVLGAGHSGLSIAARLKALDIPALVVEQNPRVGDNWRNRYESLNLHNEVWANHMPYLPYPPTWPAYCSKDKIADWFESYVSILDLNVWTGTSLERASYSPDSGRWTVELRRADGQTRTLHPRHLVLAIGVFGEARRIPLSGQDSFRGEIITSQEYRSDPGAAGRRVLIIGTGSSGHDIAQDYAALGADVTMVQRSSTCIMNVETTNSLAYALYTEDGPPLDDADLMAASTPILLSGELHRHMSRRMAEMDAELLSGLHAAGFKTDYGSDGTGFLMKYYRQGGGYYINIGASDLIVAGKIKIKNGVEIAGLHDRTVVFTDGSEIAEVDTIVLALGFRNMQDTVRSLLGDDVADAVGPVWGLRADGEVRGLYGPLGQPGLWIMGGSFVQCRLMSKVLAIQIKAREVGLAADATRVRAQA
jgi:cation diffusion facilitator CzcD-associated flavoprotein CzcO